MNPQADASPSAGVLTRIRMPLVNFSGLFQVFSGTATTAKLVCHAMFTILLKQVCLRTDIQFCARHFVKVLVNIAYLPNPLGRFVPAMTRPEIAMDIHQHQTTPGTASMLIAYVTNHPLDCFIYATYRYDIALSVIFHQKVTEFGILRLIFSI